VPDCDDERERKQFRSARTPSRKCGGLVAEMVRIARD
jgi:hypothetical protein